MTPRTNQEQPAQSAGIYRAPGVPLGASLAQLRLALGALAPSLAILLAVMVLAFVADTAALRLGPGTYHIDAGSYRDFLFLSNTYDREHDAAGVSYRWTTAASGLQFTHIDVADQAILTLHLGGRPQPGKVDLTLNGQPFAQFTAATTERSYAVMLPLRAAGQLEIGMHSEIFAEPASKRQLGVKLVAVDLALADAGAALPPLAYYGWQIGLVLAGQLIGLRLRWSWRAQALLAAALALAGALILGAALLLAYLYILRLAIAGIALAALTWILLPVLERHLTWAGPAKEIRLLWALALLACAIRLAGVLYPTFGGQDLGLNLRRLSMTAGGQMVIIDDSSEFADGLTIYPPGPYLAVLPGLVSTNDQAAVLQGVLAALDGLSAFLIALLARRLGGNRHAARLALLLYTASYPAFTAMTYGFSAQVFGQWFTAPLLLALLSPPDLTRLRTWALVAVLLLVQVFSHVGVAILATAWIGLLLLLLLSRPYRTLWQPYLLLFACAAFAFGLLYVDIAATMLSHAAGTVLQGQPTRVGWLPGATPLLRKGALLAYTDIGLAMLPLGLLLIRHITLHRRMVLLAMLLAVLLFLAVDLVLMVQVRYFYFSLPLALAAIGLVLGQIALRGRWARLLVWCLVLIVVLQNVGLWFQTTFGDGKFSLTPLTH